MGRQLQNKHQTERGDKKNGPRPESEGFQKLVPFHGSGFFLYPH